MRHYTGWTAAFIITLYLGAFVLVLSILAWVVVTLLRAVA